MSRSVSIIINTYNRAESLAETLASFEWLDHDRFEVVVVNGPSTDGTEELLARYAGRIKVGRCANRNLSESRNLGIKLAAGEIVAFIDDDAYPDPAWLNSLEVAFDNDEVAAAGGPTFGPSGFWYQAWYSRADRFGNFWTDTTPTLNPTSLLAFPGTAQFVYTIGTNSAFRRSHLVAIGGFDEEFEYYLDETDVCCRLIDRGLVVAAKDDGFVYHKFLSSEIRDTERVYSDWYQVLKSRFYFGFKHGLPASSLAEVCAQQAPFVDTLRANMTLNVEAGVLGPEALAKFEADVANASNLALERYVAGTTQERPPAWFDDPEPLVDFGARRPPGRKLHVCILSQEYTPGPVNGIARVLQSLAEGLAARGHVVRVLTAGEGNPRIDLEHGVWVHRIAVGPQPVPEGLDVVARTWNHAATMATELDRIAQLRPIDVVQAPNWDAEGLAALVAGRYPVVVGLYTPLQTVLDVDPQMRASLEAGDEDLARLVELERYVYRHADGYLACGPAIVEEIEQRYSVNLDRQRLGLVPHGLPDASLGRPAVARGSGPGLEVLFVGRLEARKGIDTLLDAVVLGREQGVDLRLTVIGDDTLPGPGGATYRQAFERSHPRHLEAVRFLGRVDDDELYAHYGAADAFVAPSRFESFGLILLEAMMFATPVVCADVGGMAEIVEDGVTGLVVPAADVEALAAALGRLAASADLRAELGAAGRQAFERRFSVPAMAEGVERYYWSLVAAASRSPVPA